MEYYSVIEVMAFAMKSMKLGIIVLSEIIQIQKVINMCKFFHKNY